MEGRCSDVASSAQLPADWNKPCSDEHLADISLLIADWRAVSPFLGLTEPEEIAILESTHSVPARKMAMLRKWKQKKGGGATYEQLSQVFRKCQLLDLEEKMKQILGGSNSLEEGPSSNPTPPPDPLISYASYLKELYTSMSQSRTSQHWAHLPQCEFIQLAMIEAQGIRREGPEEEMIRLAQQGKIETILHHKTSINLYNLFPFPPKSPKPLVISPPPGRICLIEGAPGGGKSTLALHICHQWAQGASWLAFDLVVLVYLRDEAVQNAEKLADILPANRMDIFANVVSRIASSCGKNVLFIFDGWDEFPPNLMNKSFVAKIIRQPHKLSLHQSTVLITSRPVASGNLLHIADRRVEILGFTQHQIREYIEKALENSSQVQILAQHLEEHPVIEGYCYIPLHAAILVHIFLTMKKALPTTLHELFCDLVLCSIVREHDTREPNLILPEPLSSLDDLPGDLKSRLSNLCVLAYNGVMQDKIIFYSKDLQESLLPTNISSLGLLQAVEGLTMFIKTRSYNFLHLSVQELLAARHISQMNCSEQVTVFKKLFESSRFEAVLCYYSGFTKLANPEILEFISNYQHRKESFKKILPLIHCFFEAHKPSLSQLVDTKFTENVTLRNSTNPSDYLAIGYFISSLLSTSTADMPPVKVFEDCYTDNSHGLKLLLNELPKYPICKQSTAACVLPRKLIMHLTGRYGSAKLFADHLKISPAISEFTLERGRIQSKDEDGLFHIMEALQTNTSLTKLHLVSVNLQYTEKNGSALIKMLQVNKSLTHLDLSMNESFCLRARCIFEGLQYNTSLVNLDLCFTGMTATDPDTATSFVKMLQANKSLTHLNLLRNKSFSLEAHCIFEGLQYNTSLVKLNLSRTGITATDPDTATSFIKMLQVNKSLTHLDLSFTKITDSVCRCIVDGLYYTSNLIELNLCMNINSKMIRRQNCSIFF